MSKPIFYHAGCSVCVDAEEALAKAVDAEVVHLGVQKQRVSEAEKAGVESVPALLMNGSVLHINFGAPLSDLK